MDVTDPSYSFNVYKLRSEEANLLIEGDVAADVANNAEEIREGLSLVKGDSTELLKKIESGELLETVSRVAAERVVQNSVTSEGSKPLFMRDTLDLIRERDARIQAEKVDRAMQESVTTENSKPLFTRDAIDLIRERDERIQAEKTDARVQKEQKDVRKLKEFKEVAEKYTETEEDDIVRPSVVLEDVDSKKTLVADPVIKGMMKNSQDLENTMNLGAEKKRRLTEEEYELQIKKWNEIIKGTQHAVENVESIVQEKRSSVFWRLQNLGIKNVTTGLRLKMRGAFSGFANKTKSIFGFTQNSSFKKPKEETFLPQEYITHGEESLSTIIKEQILDVVETGTLTDDQKNNVIQGLFEYAKKNPYMSMFDQVNSLSNKNTIESGEKIDLQMIQRLLTVAVDSLGNKTLIEYGKESS